MNALQAVLLGVLQGLTEFLPVSSSGHLVLLQNLFGIKEPALLFDISLHIGTLVSICAVFFQDILSILSTLIRLPALLKSSNGFIALFNENEDVRMAALIVLGSIPTAVIGVLFQKVTDQLFGSVWLVGIMLIVTGTLLMFTRYITGKGRSLKQVRSKDALIIGLVQGLAIIPGISRSGSTISTALFLKVDRETAGRYSFLLSLPAMIGALVMGLGSEMTYPAVSVQNILLGSATAAIIGFIALKMLLRVVKQGHLYFFTPYCWLLGGIVLIYSIAG